MSYSTCIETIVEPVKFKLHVGESFYTMTEKDLIKLREQIDIALAGINP